MQEPIRILSDLHLGHPASLAREISQIAPLFEGARTMIFNGDTVEMRSRKCRERAPAILGEVQAYCAGEKAVTHFINGNHDPIISTLNHLEIADGRLLVTHGDVLFDEVSKSHAGAPRVRHNRERLVSELRSTDLASFERILSTNKRIDEFIDVDEFTIPSGKWGQFTTFMKQTWPPKRFANLLTTWRQTPVHAMDLVRVYRPDVRCIVVGHTHYPGMWHRHGCSVINTGSYLPVLGRLAVDYADGAITVRKVVMRGRTFRLGRTIAHFLLQAQARAQHHRAS